MARDVDLISLGFHGASHEQFAFAVKLSRITFPYLMLISLASLLGGILNSLHKFWVNAAAPILLNIAHGRRAGLLPRRMSRWHGAEQAIAVPIGGALQLALARRSPAGPPASRYGPRPPVDPEVSG